MKKSVYFILIAQMTLAACLKDSSDSFDAFLEEWDLLNISQNNYCKTVSDAYEYPEMWTLEEAEKFQMLPAETFSSMSTCGLLETLLIHPNNIFGPWCIFCSGIFNTPGVTSFNMKHRASKVAVELFNRDDCFSVMSSKYLNIIKINKKQKLKEIDYFEMLLASDMFMEALNEKEKVQLMAMALERKFDKNLPEGQNPSEDELVYFLSVTPHIMIAIMKAFDYAPFMSEVGVSLKESLWGYHNLNDHDIIEYAKNFLNEHKHK